MGGDESLKRANSTAWARWSPEQADLPFALSSLIAPYFSVFAPSSLPLSLSSFLHLRYRSDDFLVMDGPIAAFNRPAAAESPRLVFPFPRLLAVDEVGK